MDWDDEIDYDTIAEGGFVPFTFNKVKKRDPVRIIAEPVVNISEILKEKLEARREIRCPKCGALLVENKGSPRDGRPVRLVCHFCKNKQRRANAKAKREAK